MIELSLRRSSDYDKVIGYLARNVLNNPEAIEEALSQAAANGRFERAFLILLKACVEPGALTPCQNTKFAAILFDYALSNVNFELKKMAMRPLLDPSVSLSERLQILEQEMCAPKTMSWPTLQLVAASEGSYELPNEIFHLIGRHL